MCQPVFRSLNAPSLSQAAFLAVFFLHICDWGIFRETQLYTQRYKYQLVYPDPLEIKVTHINLFVTCYQIQYSSLDKILYNVSQDGSYSQSF